MPEMSGNQLAVSIKGEKPGTPTMLSGFGNIIRSSGEPPEGVDMLKSKPDKLREIRQAVTTLANKYLRPSE
jgi:hypothetical protein